MLVVFLISGFRSCIMKVNEAVVKWKSAHFRFNLALRFCFFGLVPLCHGPDPEQ